MNSNIEILCFSIRAAGNADDFAAIVKQGTPAATMRNWGGKLDKRGGLIVVECADISKGNCIRNANRTANGNNTLSTF